MWKFNVLIDLNSHPICILPSKKKNVSIGVVFEYFVAMATMHHNAPSMLLAYISSL